MPRRTAQAGRLPNGQALSRLRVRDQILFGERRLAIELVFFG